MNDPHLILKKLNSLSNEEMAATTETEKAAIFGAVRAFVKDFDGWFRRTPAVNPGIQPGILG